MSELETLANLAIVDPAQSPSVSELHGAVVGIGVCNELSFSLQGLIDLFGVEALSTQASVEEFVNSALHALSAPDMSFALLLAGDDDPIESRLESLAEFSGSFLAGLVVGLSATGDGDVGQLPQEVQEIISDFAAIAEVEVAGADESDEAEKDFTELEEFLKVGVLLVKSQLNDPDVDIQG